jgi:hypothetical protein
VATAYTNTGGQGDRTAIIAISTTLSTAGGGGTLNNLIDGVQASNNSSDAWSWSANQTSGSITFDFGSGASKVIDEAIWLQSTSNTHGSWEWRASNDGVVATATVIGSSFTLGGATNNTLTTLSGNTTGYRYYHLVHTSGNTSATPWLQEIKFKIDDAALATLNAVAAQTIAAFSQTATLATIQRVALAQTIAAFSQSFEGTPEDREAVLAQTIPDFTQSLTSLLVPRAAMAQTIPDFTQSLAVARIRAVEISQVINDFTVSQGAVANFVHLGTSATRFRPKVSTMQVGGRPRRVR